MCSLSKGAQALLLLMLSPSNLLASATTATTCGEARIVKEEKNLEAWSAERLLRKEGPTRWMAEEGGFFVVDLGCQKIIKSIKIDNSEHLPGNRNQQGNGSSGKRCIGFRFADHVQLWLTHFTVAKVFNITLMSNVCLLTYTIMSASHCLKPLVELSYIKPSHTVVLF